MKRFVMYKNGNYTVLLDTKDGTKIRQNDLDFFDADFPESMDIKITNKCTGTDCMYCHENSSSDGKHGDIMTPSFIDKLHPYTEIALGGGNVLEHPDLIPFLKKCQNLNLIPSITINQKHFMENPDRIRGMIDANLIYGLGISMIASTDDFIIVAQHFKNAVIHVINGIISVQQLERMKDKGLKLLILGYKKFGRGTEAYRMHENIIEDKKHDLYMFLPRIIEEKWFDVVSFDNLAIRQLNPQRLMSEEEWNRIYMGDDGLDGSMTSASMYVDMVNREFAKNSTSTDRYPIMDTAVEMYHFAGYKT